MITLNLYKSCLDPASRQDSTMTKVAYSEDAFAAAGIEAGNAIQKVETVMWAQSMALQGNLLAAKDETEVALIAQGMFGEGGFFANIWKAIADAFRAIGNFIGNLFGKLTQATEKNLKALKEAVTLLTSNSKFQIIASGDTNKGRFKKGASVKVPKAPILAPVTICTGEINNVYKDEETPASQIGLLSIGGKLVFNFFTKELAAATGELDKEVGGTEGSVTAVNGTLNAMRSAQDVKWYDGDGSKGVSQAIAGFIKNILSKAPEANSALSTFIDGKEPTAASLKELATKNRMGTMNLDTDWDKVVAALVNHATLEKAEITSVTNTNILKVNADMKSPSKPEEIADITKYYKEQFASAGDVTVEDDAIKATLAVVLSCANLLLDAGTYTNLEKYFKDGKDKFMKLADKYDEKAKEFKASATSAANANGTDQPGRRNLGNQVSNLTTTGSDLSKLTKWFSQLSLKWYQTVDQITTIAIGNTYNAVVVLTKSLEANTVEFA